jgi:predicted ATPase
VSAKPTPNEGGHPEWRATFGPFRLSPSERLLEREGVPVRLGGRALDLLIALVDRAGETVSKRDLLQRVWPNVVVEEGSLRFHMVAVRKALSEGEGGSRYITNVAGRGYAFVADVQLLRDPIQQVSRANAPARPRSLPAMASSLVGRADAVSTLHESLFQHRFVSVVGPGGIGKTSVAVATAHAALAQFEGDVAFVDFSGVSDPSLACSTIAQPLGVSLHASDEQESLIAFLERRRMLLVLDCCEHVVAAVANITEGIYSRAPEVHVLATSREPLRAAGEYVYRLAPLGYPPQPDAIPAQEALAYPAVKLFVDRAAAAVSGFQLTDAEAPLVSRLCRELDGIALAIELAAGRLEAYGVRAIAEHLDKRMKLMWHGRRTAVPRQQTMGATLDWSHNLLTEPERAVLRRLSVFSGGFNLEAAAEVASVDCTPAAVLEDLASLISKSLINVDAGGAQLRYMLLDTTRAYSQAKLAESGELDAICSRHARFFGSWLRPTQGELSSSSVEAVILELDNLRSAMEWCLTDSHDLAAGAMLGAVTCPALLRVALLAECRRWAQAIVNSLPSQLIGTTEEMLLQGALAQSLMYTAGSTAAAESAFRRSIEVASARDPKYQLSLLNGYGVCLSRGGHFSAALEVARQADAIVGNLADPEARAMIDSMLGTALHFVGQNDLALTYWDRCIAAGPAQKTTRARIGYDHYVCALCGKAQSLRLAGQYTDAVAAAIHAIAKAKTTGHPPTYCITLVWTATIFVPGDEASRVEETIAELHAEATKNSFAPYLAVAVGLRGQLDISQGAPEAGVAALRAALEELHRNHYEIRTTVFLTSLGAGLLALSQLDEGLEVCADTISRIERQGDYLHLPEALVLQGRILYAQGRPREAGSALTKAMQLARAQSSKPAQLTAAMAMYEIRNAVGEGASAEQTLRDLLESAGEQKSPVLARARAMLG